MQNILQKLDHALQQRKLELLQNISNSSSNISYVQSLYSKGTDAILKKIIEEAGEVIMAAKDMQHNIDNNSYEYAQNHMIYEIADVWFHTLILLHHNGLSSQNVLNELSRREGKSGIIEKQDRNAKN